MCVTSDTVDSGQLLVCFFLFPVLNYFFFSFIELYFVTYKYFIKLRKKELEEGKD